MLDNIQFSQSRVLKIVPAKQQEIEENLDEEEKKIIELLQREPYLSDDLANEIQISAGPGIDRGPLGLS